MMRLPADFWRELIAHKGYSSTHEPDSDNYVTISAEEASAILDLDGRRFWHEWRLKTGHRSGLSVAASTVILEEPTLVELAANFTKATARWIKAGLPVATKAETKARKAICLICEHHRPDATFLKCAKCGCSKVKLWLATERCPIGKWESVQLPKRGSNRCEHVSNLLRFTCY
jgi:hypothetical protein